MKDNSVHGDFGFPWALVWAVLVLIGIELGLAVFWPGKLALKDQRFYDRPERPSLAESVIQWQVYDLLTLKRPQRIVLIGDSSCLMGLRPRVIMSATSHRTWNFGLVGTVGLAGIVDLAELYVKRHGPPRLMVLFVTVGRLTRPESADSQRALERFRTWLDRITTWRAIDLLPSYRLRLLVRSPMIWPPLLDQKRGIFPSDNEIRRLLLANRGYLPETRVQRGPRPAMRNRWSRFAEARTPELRRLFRLAAKRRFILLIVTMPLPEQARTRPWIDTFKRVETRLRALVAPYRNVEIFQPFCRFFLDREISANHNHLLPRGAKRNSLAISQWIVRRLGSGADAQTRAVGTE